MLLSILAASDPHSSPSSDFHINWGSTEDARPFSLFEADRIYYRESRGFRIVTERALAWASRNDSQKATTVLTSQGSSTFCHNREARSAGSSYWSRLATGTHRPRCSLRQPLPELQSLTASLGQHLQNEFLPGCSLLFT